jgi:hypothetical protein
LRFLCSLRLNHVFDHKERTERRGKDRQTTP